VGARCQKGRRHKRAVRSSVGAGLWLGRYRIRIAQASRRKGDLQCGAEWGAALRGVALGSGQVRPQWSPRNMRRGMEGKGKEIWVKEDLSGGYSGP
jgi:hypothetical protein